MAAVRMYVEKFGREVLIDKDHPLAVAERAKTVAVPVSGSGSHADSAAHTTDTRDVALLAAVPVAPAADVKPEHPDKPNRSRQSRRQGR